MRTLKRHFLLVILLFGGLLHSSAQQDCFNAINVCSNSYNQNNSFSGSGDVLELQPGATCLGNGEVNSVWYTFTASTSGNMRFQLNPLNPNDDYDFALFNMTNDSCSGIAQGLTQPISCNYSADPGPTGLSSGASGSNNGSSDPNQNPPVAVQEGETYLLLISNFTASQNGYQLNFMGTGSIVDDQSPELDTVDPLGVCNPRRIVLSFTEDIECSSINSNGSEITVTGPSAVTVANVSGIGCGGGTDRIRITFANKIQATGVYTITIGIGTDGNSYFDGCGNEIPAGTTITFNVEFIGPDVNIINVLGASCGQDEGTAEANVINGTPPLTFNWNSSPGQSTAVAVNLEPDIYRVIVTDANGCTDKATVSIDNNSSMDLSNNTIGPVSCNGAADGTAQVVPAGGVSPYSVQWQTSPVQNGNNANNLPGGDVVVIVTDADGCEDNITLTIPEPAALNLPTIIVNPDCGIANGTATVNPVGGNGGFSYLWDSSPPQTTVAATGLMAGVYSVDVIDSEGCTANTTVILTDNFAPDASIESRIPDCGQGVGSATALVSSGTAPYAYSWNTTPAQNTATAIGLSEGDYFVTITDAAGCTQIINVKIDSVPPPQITVATTPPDCGQANGEAVASATDGVAPFTFEWTSSANTTATETGLAEGTFTVTLTDNIGCIATENFTLEALPPISDFTFSNACLGYPITFVPTSTSGATSWLWDFGDGTTSTEESPTHQYSSIGAYEVTVIFEGGCATDEVTQTTETFAPPTVTFAVEPDIITTRTDANFIYTGNGGSVFLWDFGDGTTSTENAPIHLFGVDGFYPISLVVTDANGCVDSTRLTIEVVLQPVIYFPNAFIPEGTTENSRFKGYGIGITGAELSVFNRWGALLYFSDNLNEILNSGWDGTFNGKPALQGVYPYKVKASFYNNSTFEKLGTVTLIR